MQTDGFSILKIHSRFPNDPTFDTISPPLPDIFSQPFTYLGSGGQAYAFVSADGNYVLKFFKHHHHTTSKLKRLLPSKHKRQLKREKKRLRDLSSYKLAMEILPKETGLLYVHLNTTDYLNTRVTIYDKLHIAHELNLDEVPFVLQKKATLAYSYLDELIKNGMLEEAQEAIDSICHLIISRCRQGIYDEDPRIHRNVGFINGKAMLIDVGRLKPDPRRHDPQTQRDDLIKITKRLEIHLRQKSPQLADYLNDHVESCPL